MTRNDGPDVHSHARRSAPGVAPVGGSDLFGDEPGGEPVQLLVPQHEARARTGEVAVAVTEVLRADGPDLLGRRADGTEFPAEISLSTIETDDGMVATAAIHDVSGRTDAERGRRERAQGEKDGLEEQLNQLRRLESVGQLAGGIAHDFNNILAVILNSAAFVAEDLDEDSPMLQDVQEIKRSAQRAAALTRQLLIFSRRDIVHLLSLDLNELVSELERLLRRVLGEHVVLETRFAPGLRPVTADPGQIEQVLVNL
ncbi:MAG: hypothetical protein QOJ12_2338, partial [Thermoleophilales bacterium]|nr:hypothetical protein [Thermoleophilales bacterium]